MRSRARILAALLSALLAATVWTGSPSNAKDDDTSIVGGTQAGAGEFPWAVYLNGCGGSLIRPDVVLSAGHCFSGSGSNTSVTGRVNSIDSQSGGTTIRSSYVHDAGDIGNDWALIKLQTPVSGVPLLALNSSSALNTGTFTVMGWGDTSEGGSASRYLRKADVPFVSDSTCDSLYNGRITVETEICAGPLEGGVDSCQGDSGGPMVKRNAAGAWVQIGIVSWGDGCARPNKPGVYAEVSALYNAINAKADELSGGGTPTTCPALSNGTNVNIPDLSTVTSSIAVSGCSGNASTATRVEVHIEHTYRGDLQVDLVAPDGSAYRLKSTSSSDSADDVHATYTVNAGSEPRNGTWRLRVRDAYSGDTGYIDTWTLTV